MPNIHVTITGPDRDAMADLVRVHDLRVYPQTLVALGDGTHRVDAVVDPDAPARLRGAGYGVEEHEDVDAPTVTEQAAAAAEGYLGVDDVEERLGRIASANDGLVELVELPHHTWEERVCHAARLRGADPRAGVFLLGGVHAREWGSPDILVHFLEELVAAHQAGSGLEQGGASFTAAQVRSVVDNLEIVVFPQANPDGRQHSMTTDPMWRKNKRPPEHGSRPCPVGGGKGPGVDINRNYDFLWDFRAKYSRDAPVATSDHPCDETYAGPAVASEPETRNVAWLLDQHPAVGHLIDVHSFGEDILYNWGDDNDQTTDPEMNFHNPAWDGERGVPDSSGGQGYREYIPPADRDSAVSLATAMRDAISAAHGRNYTVKESVDLYPTSGTSDDFAYSRGFLGRGLPTVLGYVIEWGPQRSTIPKSFHPDYADMEPIIEEVTAGLFAFCVEVAARTVQQPSEETVPADAGLAGPGRAAR